MNGWKMECVCGGMGDGKGLHAPDCFGEKRQRACVRRKDVNLR